MKETDDLILVERIKAGQIDAFRELVDRFKQPVYALARDLTGNHHDAEDLSQEVFMSVYKSINQFRQDANLHSWLYRITVNGFINKKRKKILRIIKLSIDRDEAGRDFGDPVELGIEGDPERHAQSALIQRHISAALDKLAPREKAVFIMKHYHDQKIPQIAETLSISPGTVKSLLFRGIQKLKKELSFYKADLGLENL
ncbi:RNA polymerase sigma factor [candidate division KSB1 bacterium]|nr:RNA polymerase sigma factor [candidate division KSB1 bacterium]